jgi:O-antigen/teichoic acid export membrane protein
MEENLANTSSSLENALASEIGEPELSYGMPTPVLPLVDVQHTAASQADLSKERNRRFFWSVVSALCTRPLAVVISLVSVPIFFKNLGKERYGLYESLGAVAVWFGMTNAGLGLGLLNKLTDCYVSGNKELARKYVTTILFALPAIALAVIVGLSVVTPFVPWGKVFPMSTGVTSETAWGFWWAGVITAIGVVVGCNNSLYMGYQEIVRANLWDAVAKIATLLACIGFAFTHFGVVGAIFATAGAPTLIRAINMLWILGYEKPFLRPKIAAFDWTLLRVLLTEGSLLLVLQLSAIALFQTDKVIIGIVRGPAEVPEFSVVGRLYFTAYGVFVLLIGPLWPTAAEAIRRGDLPWVSSTLRRSLLIGCGGMACIGVVMFFFGDKLVNIWTRGGQPTVSRAMIVGLTATFMMRSWTECQSIVLNAANVLAPQARVLVSNAVLNCVAAVILVHYYGALGAAWSIPISTALTSGWAYPLLFRRHLTNIPSVPEVAVT